MFKHLEQQKTNIPYIALRWCMFHLMLDEKLIYKSKENKPSLNSTSSLQRKNVTTKGTYALSSEDLAQCIESQNEILHHLYKSINRDYCISTLPNLIFLPITCTSRIIISKTLIGYIPLTGQNPSTNVLHPNMIYLILSAPLKAK